jgi:inorganic pyrophosphatase
MSDLTRLDPRMDAEALTCRAVIETPKGRRGKLAYDPASGAFELKRMLPDGMSFPLDFGFVPGTRGQDGDPLDILVLGDEPAAIGTLLTARLIGLIEAEQSEDGETVRNDRILAVAALSRLFAKVAKIDDLDADFLKNLVAFWENYDALRGVRFRVLAVRDGKAAARLIGG